jgi:hypothetical protein
MAGKESPWLQVASQCDITAVNNEERGFSVELYRLIRHGLELI